MADARDTWDPQTYARFADERAAPFHDLLGMIEPVRGGTVADLGCGPGTLTRELHRVTGAASTVGVDSSPRMLERAGEGDGLRFDLSPIETWEPDGPLDVVFSNAALHWVGDHQRLFARLSSWLAPDGQLAVQIPDNLDAITHTTAAEVARAPRFAAQLADDPPRAPLLSAEQYAILLHDLGFARIHVERRIYLHLLDGPEDLVAWFRGSLLSEYERRLDAPTFDAFLTRYRELLLQRVEQRRPYPLAFPRLLMWARREPRAAVLRGTVVVGERLGRQLGFPTANVRLGPDAPPFGIYAGRVFGRPAAVSIGVRPTIGDRMEPLAEAHLLDFDGDLYGQEIEIELVQRLRPELRFDSLDLLRRQIERDVEAIRALLAAGRAR